MAMILNQRSFPRRRKGPAKYTGDGADVSPPLRWPVRPPAAEFALICDDPDAPRARPWVHWVIYKIPAGTDHLPEGVHRSPQPAVPAGPYRARPTSAASATAGRPRRRTPASITTISSSTPWTPS